MSYFDRTLDIILEGYRDISGRPPYDPSGDNENRGQFRNPTHNRVINHQATPKIDPCKFPGVEKVFQSGKYKGYVVTNQQSLHNILHAFGSGPGEQQENVSEMDDDEKLHRALSPFVGKTNEPADEMLHTIQNHWPEGYDFAAASVTMRKNLGQVVLVFENDKPTSMGTLVGSEAAFLPERLRNSDNKPEDRADVKEVFCHVACTVPLNQKNLVMNELTPKTGDVLNRLVWVTYCNVRSKKLEKDIERLFAEYPTSKDYDQTVEFGGNEFQKIVCSIADYVNVNGIDDWPLGAKLMADNPDLRY